jgi:hypothetical protein
MKKRKKQMEPEWYLRPNYWKIREIISSKLVGVSNLRKKIEVNSCTARVEVKK